MGPSSGAPVAQQSPWQWPVRLEGVAALAPQYGAVDDDGVYAAGVGDQAIGAAGKIMDAAQRAGGDAGRIEHHDIGGPAYGEAAAIGDAEHVGGTRGQHAHR